MNGLLWRPLDPQNIADPYAMYAALRRQDPVHRAQTGEFIVTQYGHIRDALKNPAFQSGNRLQWLEKGIRYFDNKREDFSAIYQAMNAFILMLNDEQHARVRNFISRTWNDRDVDALVMENARNVLASIQTNEFDAVTDFAQPIPVLTIAGILGVPVADHHHLMQLGVAMTKTLDLYVSLKDLVMMNQAAKEFIAYFREQIKIKKEKPDDGLLGRIVRKNKEEKAGLTEEELISIGIFLFTAGEETSAGLISNTLLHLGRHPDQRDLLRKDPGLMAQVIDEVLRYDSVVQLLGRLTREDVMLGGKVIPKDSAVTLVVGSGNRDAQAFEEPDRFIISRRPNRHLSFGSGAHYCLGDWLGRRQSQLAVSTFLQRFPGYRLVDGGHSWYKNIAIRRLDKLIVQAGS